nr:hypothetical protein [Roseomonas sp. GC11]
MKAAGVTFSYEALRLPYVQSHYYTPDFLLQKLDGSTMIVETKGYFPSDDRGRIKRALEANPGLDFRMLFSNPLTKIGKKSATTYAAWCDRLGIPWAKAPLPQAWLDECRRG